MRLIRKYLHRLAWWYISRCHDADPGMARLHEYILRNQRKMREPELYDQTNEIFSRLDRGLADHCKDESSVKREVGQVAGNGTNTQSVEP